MARVCSLDGLQSIDCQDTTTLGADARNVVDQTDAGGATSRERGVEVGGGEADVVDSRPASLDELVDWAAGGGGLEQLHECVAGGEGGDVRTIGIVNRYHGETEHVAIKGKCAVDRSNGNSDVGDAIAAPARPATAATINNLIRFPDIDIDSTTVNITSLF